MKKEKCEKCKHHRPKSKLIGQCVLQSVNNTNAKDCEDFKNE